MLLLRHGQTTAGDHAFLGSRSDPALSEEGQKQAQHVSRCLSSFHFSAVVVSPLRRARETAALAVPHASVRIDQRIREIDYGLFSGLSVAEVERRYPRELHRWQQMADAPLGGEPFTSVAVRTVAAVLDAVGSMPQGSTVLFVSHNLPLRILLASARGKPLDEWRQARTPHGGLRSIRLTPLVLARWRTVLDDS